ncbi:hypothetical protein N9W34_03995 [Rickettsiales bacterium]|nr:hypothetical protein [Rickettsiales bacterium]
MKVKRRLKKAITKGPWGRLRAKTTSEDGWRALQDSEKCENDGKELYYGMLCIDFVGGILFRHFPSVWYTFFHKGHFPFKIVFFIISLVLFTAEYIYNK